MRISILLLSIFSTSVFAMGSGKPPKVDEPNHRKPSPSAKVYYAKNGFEIKSENDIPNIGKVSGSNPMVWDLQGAILDGKNQRGDGGQGENQEPLIRVRTPLIIKNGFVRNNKNAIQFYSRDSGIEKLTFTNIGEDAVSTSNGALGFTVKNCEFINDREGDKSIQLNEAKDARITDSLVFSGITCVRVGDSNTTNVSDQVEIKGNRFLGCRTAINASKITVIESSNKFEKTKKNFELNNGAKVK